MDDSLESLLEKATNPRNRYEDWEFIMAFCDKVNAHLQGPQVALRIIVPKIQSGEEKVALLSLALLEACVKNCGQRFHQELGKFRFLNELIRLISPKYLGNQTPLPVKERTKELLYSWKTGLPHEAKINEAFLMLKREGLVFDESKPPDETLQPEHQKPKVSLIQDPKQSRMLQKLLSSKNPEDLRAANRLIREMVRRDEKRMQKLQQRLEDVELIQNNVKLLNELLIHYREDSAEQERPLIEELYKSIDKLRPKIFRMASELRENEEGMTEILRTNESVLRVMDLYTTKIGNSGSGSVAQSASASSNSTAESAGKASTTTSEKEDLSAASQNGVAASSSSGGATGGGEASDSVLIDLADLNFDPIMGGGSGGGGGGGGASSGGLDLNSSLSTLMDDISSLDLGTPTNSNTNILGMQFPPPPNAVGGAQPSFGFGPGGFQAVPLTVQQQQLGQGLSGSPLLGGTPLLGGAPSSTGSSSNSASSQPPPSLPLPFGSSSSPAVTIPPPPRHPAAVAATTGGGSGLFGLSPTQQATPLSSVPVPVPAPSPSPAGGDPLAVLDNLSVALETIKPGSVPPMSVVSKNNVAVTFYFAENSPAPGVSIIIISIISTSPVPVSNFQFQAAVPKVMRVKLQPPTTMEMNAYNPVLPPPSISQVLLLANPTKAKVRMKYRISYKPGGAAETVELGEIVDFPVL